jgi:hypothetical protein
MIGVRLSDAALAELDVSNLEYIEVEARAEAVRWEEYAQRVRRRLVELRGRC